MPMHGRRQAEAPADTPDAQRQCVWWAPAIARASPADAQMRRELARQMDGLMARIDPTLHWSPAAAWLVPIPQLQACVASMRAVLGDGAAAVSTGGPAQQRVVDLTGDGAAAVSSGGLAQHRASAVIDLT